MTRMITARKIALLAVVAMVLAAPAAVFAEIGIGVAAFSDTPILAAEDVNKELLDGSFSFGANGRMHFNSLMLDALGLYASAEKSVDLYLTAQLTTDLLGLIRVSGGVGPAIRIPLAAEGNLIDNLSVDWVNAKVDVDVLLFNFSVGLSFQYLIPSSDVQAIDFSLARGRIGASVLIW